MWVIIACPRARMCRRGSLPCRLSRPVTRGGVQHSVTGRAGDEARLCQPCVVLPRQRPRSLLLVLQPTTAISHIGIISYALETGHWTTAELRFTLLSLFPTCPGGDAGAAGENLLLCPGGGVHWPRFPPRAGAHGAAVSGTRPSRVASTFPCGRRPASSCSWQSSSSSLSVCGTETALNGPHFSAAHRSVLQLLAGELCRRRHLRSQARGFYEFPYYCRDFVGCRSSSPPGCCASWMRSLWAPR